MIEEVLASVKVINAPGILIVLIALAVYVFIFALVIICLVRASRYFRNAGKEQKLIRMDIGKLAEEVHLLRQEMEGAKDSQSD